MDTRQPSWSANGGAVPPSDDRRLQILDATIKRYQYQQDALIEILHKAQDLFGALESDRLLYIARSLKLPPSRVYGVATFYHLFFLTPKGRHQCIVCTGTACYAKDAAALVSVVKQSAQIQVGQTTSDNQLSLSTARCLGVCGIAPVVVFDDVVCGGQTPASVRDRV